MNTDGADWCQCESTLDFFKRSCNLERLLRTRERPMSKESLGKYR